jgi:hypothetical protein
MTLAAPALTGDQIAAELHRLEREAAASREAYWDAKTHAQSLMRSAEAETARLALKHFRAEHSL